MKLNSSGEKNPQKLLKDSGCSLSRPGKGEKRNFLFKLTKKTKLAKQQVPQALPSTPEASGRSLCLCPGGQHQGELQIPREHCSGCHVCFASETLGINQLHSSMGCGRVKLTWGRGLSRSLGKSFVLINLRVKIAGLL